MIGLFISELSIIRINKGMIKALIQLSHLTQTHFFNRKLSLF